MEGHPRESLRPNAGNGRREADLKKPIRQIKEFIDRVIEVVIKATEACFGPLSTPAGLERSDAIFADGIAVPGGCGKRLLRMGSRGEGNREELLIVLLLSPEAASGESLAEAKRWAQETFQQVAAIDAVPAEKVSVFVSRGGASPAALYKVTIRGVEDLPG